ncbi:hypothetical protein E2C01_091042 [Portunus trituberculatus]|uniref:Uncharacterized protein n=1 Tax=Portunus trituberculatus TaxID=210409 RepID=A0A5B7JMH6_PORTR|nr:hypothetical protein [Portunus trituberculatus]
MHPRHLPLPTSSSRLQQIQGKHERNESRLCHPSALCRLQTRALREAYPGLPSVAMCVSVQSRPTGNI